MTERETITTAEAAELLGVSQTAIKARLKRGTLDGEQARPGAPWRVYRDALPAKAVEAVAHVQQVEADHAAELEALRQQVVAEREAERQQHAAEREALAERIGHLTGQVEAQQAELAHLRAQDARFADVVAELARLQAEHRALLQNSQQQAALPGPAEQQPPSSPPAAPGDAVEAAGERLKIEALRAKVEALEASQRRGILGRLLGR